MFWDDEEESEIEFDTPIPELKLAQTYETQDGGKAHLMYHLKVHGELIFFGHVFQTEDSHPVAVQWFEDGNVNPLIYDDGFRILGLWAGLKPHIRYVYLYIENNKIKTGVSEHIPESYISIKKVTL